MATDLSVNSDSVKRAVDMHRSINTSNPKINSYEFFKEGLQTFVR